MKPMLRIVLYSLISHIILCHGFSESKADTVSWPVSVAIPTGMVGEMQAKPVSVGIPTGMLGEMSSKPVSVAMPTSIFGGVYESRPATVGRQPEKLGDPDLVGLWHMDGDWSDSSGNGNHGTPYNGVTFSTNTKLGASSGNFDGVDDYVSIGNLYGKFPNNTFSTEAWVKLDSTGSGSRRTIVGGTGVWADYAIGLYQNQFTVFVYNGLQNSNGTYALSGVVPNLGDWYHVAGIYDGSQLKIYINGVLKSTVSAVWSQKNSGVDFWIGGEYCCGGVRLDGLIDEIAIYKRALSADEIAQHFAAGINDDSNAPAAPVLNAVPAFSGTNSITLSGTKPANTSIWVNNKKIVASDTSTTWSGSYATLQPGINLLNITSFDEINRLLSTQVSKTVFFDNIPPTIESSTPATNSSTAKVVNSVTIILNDANAGVDLNTCVVGATVKNSAGQIINGSWNTVAPRTIIFTPSAAFASDTYTVTIQATDLVGNKQQQQIVFTNHDTNPPTTKITLAGTKDSAGWFSTPATVTLTADDTADGSGIAKLEYSLDGGTTWVPYTTPFVIDLDGKTTVQYRATDRAGNVESAKSHEIKINKTGLVGWWKMDGDWKDSSMFGNDGTPYNGTIFSTNAKIGTHAGSFNGSNNYVDLGNSTELQSVGSHTLASWVMFNAFTTGWFPLTPIQKYRYGLFYNTTSKFLRAHRDDGNNIYFIDHAITLLPSTWYHVAQVFDGTNLSIFVNGELKTQEIGTTSSLATTNISTTLGIGWDSTDAHKLNGSLDDVRIYNRALSPTEVMEQYRNLSIGVPTVNPVVTPVNTPTINLSGSKPANTSVVISNGSSSVEIAPQWDSAAWAATTWSGQYTLVPGINNLNVTSKDVDGYHSQPAMISVALDQAAPTVISSSPIGNSMLNVPVLTISINLQDAFSALDLSATIAAATVKNSFNFDVLGTWTTNGSGTSGSATFTPSIPMSEGTYTATIIPTDSFGNNATATLSFTIDMIAPVAPTIDAVPSPTNNISKIITGIKSVETARVVVSSPGAVIGQVSYPSATTWSVSVFGLHEGNVTITAIAFDAAGNQSPTITASFSVDLTPPGKPIINAVISQTKQTSITLSGNKEAGSYLYANYTKTSAAYADSSWISAVTLVEGSNAITVFAKDEAGNQSPSAQATVVRDTTPPTIISSTPTTNAISGTVGSILITLSGGSAAPDLTTSTTGAVVKNASGAVISGIWSVSGNDLLFASSVTLPEGIYNVTIYPVDALGNKGSASFSFTVDLGPPTVQYLAISPVSPLKAGSATFTITFSESMNTGVQPAVIFGSANNDIAGSWIDAKIWRGSATLTTLMGDGSYTVTVKGAKDLAGNTMVDQAVGTFALDTIAPALPTVAAVSALTRTATQLLIGTKPVDTSIVINNIVRVPFSSATSWSYGYPLTEGNNTLNFVARDAAGNDSATIAPAPAITLDTTPPLFTVDVVTNPATAAAQTISGKKEPGSIVKINGTVIFDATDQNAIWSTTINLVDGISNRFVFTASDIIGNVTTKTMDILFDSAPPPALAIGVLTADGSGKGTEVTLAWPAYSESTALTYYRVFKGSVDFTNVSGLIPIGTVNKGTKTFKASGLTQGSRVWFAVVPVSTSGNSDPAVHTVSAIPVDTLPPEDVKGLSAVAGYSTIDGNNANLYWTAGPNTNSDLADQILYMDAGTGYDSGAALGKTVTTFTQKGLNDATVYKFKITTKDTLNHESAGSLVQAATRLANPVGITVIAGNSKATINWTAVSSPYLKFYNIYRIKSDSAQSDIGSMALVKSQTTTSFTDTGLDNGATYQYAVTVLNTSGAERSNVQSLAVTPRGDITGPVLNGVSLTTNQVITKPVAITVSAADAENAMDRIELYIDAAKVATIQGSSLSWSWNPADTTDGNHTVKIVAFDTPGNKTESSIPVVVSLAAPPAPVITTTFGSPINLKNTIINGTIQPGATVSLRVNGIVVSSTPISSSSFSFASVLLNEGDNYISAKASNRGGESGFSAEVKVSVVTTAPSAPTVLMAKTLAAGTIQFGWLAGTNGAPVGYNLYEGPAGSASLSDAGVRKTNSSLITYLLKEYIPSDDSTRGYMVTAVDGAGNESAASNVINVTADRLSPAPNDVLFNSGGTTPSDNTYGSGPLTIALTVSEALSETPFLSLEPLSGSPLVVSLRKVDDTHFEGSLTIDATSPHGATIWKFSGKDLVGNRGIGQGIGPILDVKGPGATVIAPVKLLKITAGPVAMSIMLDEASTITPVISLTSPDGSSVPVTGLITTNNFNWSGTVDPASLGEGTGRFVLSDARDRFNNKGTAVAGGAGITLYKVAPPASSVPIGLTAKAFKGREVRLAWKIVTDAQGYKLYRQRTADASPVLVDTISGSSTVTATDTPTEDGSFAYSISSIGLLEVESVQSAQVNVITDGTPPPLPTGLALSLTGNGVKAEWQAGVGEAATYYRIYRSAAPISDISGLIPVATVNQPTGNDPSPDASLRYYSVTSLDQLGNESIPSASQEITIPVMPVRNLLLTRVDEGKPTLSWEGGEAGLQGFHIYRNGNRITTTPTLSITFSDGYYSSGSVTYGISAVNGMGTESQIREVTLPVFSIGLKEGTVLRRGVLENAIITASLPAGSTTSLSLDSIAIKIGSLPESTENGPFVIPSDKVLEISKVTASEANAQSQTAVVISAVIKPVSGVTVKITRSVTAGVIAAGAPLEIFNEPMIRGTQGKVRIKVANTGSARMEIVSSENSGPSSQIRILLKDQDGNLLAQGHMAQRAGSQVVDSGAYATIRLEPGESFLSDPITFIVPSNAPYKVALEAVIDNTWYHYGQPDQVTAPGLRQSVDGTIADVSYLAVAQTNKSVYKQGESIVITGTTNSTADNNPMTNVPVKVGISVKGFDRFATVNSDNTGAFSYTFTPGSSEAGSYSVWASHPDLSDRNVQAQFSIIGLQVSPLQANIRLLKGQSYDIPVTLTNLGGSPLTGLSFTNNASSGMSAAVVNQGNTVLNPGENRNVTFRVGADQSAPASGFASLAIITKEGLSKRLDASIITIAAIPVIAAMPSYIETGLMRGNQRIENLTIRNTGAGTLINPRIEGPSLSWLVLTVDKNIGDIQAGQSRTIGILIKPSETMPQGVYDDRVVIYSDNHIPYTYNIQVTITSSAVGNVQFSVLNELMKDVAGASITFQHQSLPELIQTVKTDTSGTATVFDLPEGRYSYNISAPGAMPTSGSFVIVPGITASVPIAMEVNLVTVEWSVTPVTITDSYDIRITQTFETNVPTPVLVVEPAGINLPDLQPGQVFNGELTVTNYGLIALDNVKATFLSSIGDIDIELMSSSLPNRLNAMQKVVVPYRITRRITTASNTVNICDEITGFGGGTCYSSKLLYSVTGTAVICPNTPQQKTVEKKSDVYGNFPTTCPVGGGGIGGGGTSGSGGSYSGGGTAGGGTQGFGGAGAPVITSLTSNEPCSCKPDNTPCPSDGNLCTDDFCNGGACIHFPNSVKLPDMNIGDCKDKVCSNGAPSDKINNGDKPTSVCKDCSGGNVVNLASGAKARDNQSCCFEGESQPNYPISDLDNCPNRVRNINPDLLTNGCGSEGGTKVPDNPMWDAYQLDEGYYSKHNSSHGDFKLACDGHDSCYSGCNSSKIGCDVTFGDTMKAACYSAFSSTIWDAFYLSQCLTYAILYDGAVIYGGRDAYDDTQKKICNCCYK